LQLTGKISLELDSNSSLLSEYGHYSLHGFNLLAEANVITLLIMSTHRISLDVALQKQVCSIYIAIMVCTWTSAIRYTTTNDVSSAYCFIFPPRTQISVEVASSEKY